MKNYLIVCGAVFLFLAVTERILAQPTWTQTNGPYGPVHINAIVPADNFVLVSTGCGQHLKNSFPAKWNLNSVLPFTAWTRKGDSLFVGDTRLELIDLTNPFADADTLSNIYFNCLFHTDTCLYAGDDFTGFQRSGDFGQTWTFENSGLPTDSVWDPRMGNYNYYNPVFAITATANYLFTGTGKGIFRNIIPAPGQPATMAFPFRRSTSFSLIATRFMLLQETRFI